MLLRVLFLQ